jgi:hypothetical protein
VKVKAEFTSEQAVKDQRGSRGITVTFLNLGAGWRWAVIPTLRPLYPLERDPVPIV